MKYYAVTDDPRELYHYGVKGMKWGQHLFGDDLKPKSAGYKNAVKKLKTMNKSKLPAKPRSSLQNNRSREERRYEKAVQAAQNRIKTIENLRKYDTNKSTDKDYYKELKIQQKAAKYLEKKAQANAKRNLRGLKNSARSEKKLDKYMQQAREGRLRYGKLSDDQIQKIQDRLSLEAQARRLDGAENMSFRRRLGNAIGKGVLSGVERGIGASMEELAKAKVQTSLAGRHELKKKAKLEGQTSRIRSREINKKSHRDVINEVKNEAYEAQLRNGEGFIKRNVSNIRGTTAAKALDQANSNKRLKENYTRYLEDHNLDDKTARQEFRQKLADAGDYATLDKFDNQFQTRGQNDAIRAQQRMMLEYGKKEDRIIERQRKFEDKYEESRQDKYRKYLDERGISDKDARDSNRNALDPEDRKEFDKLSDNDQREKVTQLYDYTKNLQDAAQKAADRINTQLQDRRERAAYDAEQIRQQQEAEYKIRIDDYKDDLKNYRKDYSQWQNKKPQQPADPSNKKAMANYRSALVAWLDKEPEKPTPPARPLGLTYDQHKNLPKGNKK